MMRGDVKWPPEETRQKMLDEKAEQEVIAAGPVQRPKKVKKDYSEFFNQHKLNSAFPGYKPAPGTQYFKTSMDNQCNGSNNSNTE